MLISCPAVNTEKDAADLYIPDQHCMIKRPYQQGAFIDFRQTNANWILDVYLSLPPTLIVTPDHTTSQ